jgi:hypothetical protein
MSGEWPDKLNRTGCPWSKVLMNSQAILTGMAFTLTGAVLISAIYQTGPAGGLFNGSLTYNHPSQALLTNSFIPPAFLNANPPLALEYPNLSGSEAQATPPITPRIYVTHPWVIDVLVPGVIDQGIVQGSIPDNWVDHMARNLPPALGSNSIPFQ